MNLNFVWATFSKTHKWWLGQVSRLFLLACPLFSRDIFLAAGPRRGEKIQQEFGPSKPVFLHAWLFCTQQILSLWIKAVCVEVRGGRCQNRQAWLQTPSGPRSLLITRSPRDSSQSHKQRGLSCGPRNSRSLPATITSETAPRTPLILSSSLTFYRKMWAALEIFSSILITGIHASLSLFSFFSGGGQLAAPQRRAGSLQDRSGIHSGGLATWQLAGIQGRGRKPSGRAVKGKDPHWDTRLWTFIDFISIHCPGGKLGHLRTGWRPISPMTLCGQLICWLLS